MVVVLVAVVLAAISGVAIRSAPPDPLAVVADEEAAEPTGVGGVDPLHDAGLTGEGVRVGIVDATGFALPSDRVQGAVSARRRFGKAAVGERPGGRHGAAAAETVHRLAPGASLYLASFSTPGEFERAVEWLVRNDVDVLLVPVAFYGRRGDGSSRVAAVVTAAAEAGVTVVTAAGNTRSGHWAGRFDPDDDGVHRFAGGSRSYLLNGSTGRVSVWLRWSRVNRSQRANVTVSLYRSRGDRATLVAQSRPYRRDETPNVWLSERVDPGGSYYVEITGPADLDGVPLELVSPTHRLQYITQSGSVVAPATARRALTVGAVDRRTGRLEPFSSVGPVDDRPGVDVVAPSGFHLPARADRFVGTSAAAAYAAGVVALVLDANPVLTPRRVEAVVESTAVETGPDGVDPVTGSGRLDPITVVRRAGNVSAGG
ncbi:subtilase protease [Candidatus Halobonum tyrrellensis G22]|uniref:Subtilase protease n=1 Tax=Candidatus Halobonum tyrrellensis G22 TaxID=1324957 RepID=V4IWQ0_9EURY|nr:subtilase protease [Candidatus Halobonum tyrrellensis G22]